MSSRLAPVQAHAEVVRADLGLLFLQRIGERGQPLSEVVKASLGLGLAGSAAVSRSAMVRAARWCWSAVRVSPAATARSPACCG